MVVCSRRLVRSIRLVCLCGSFLLGCGVLIGIGGTGSVGTRLVVTVIGSMRVFSTRSVCIITLGCIGVVFVHCLARVYCIGFVRVFCIGFVRVCCIGFVRVCCIGAISLVFADG